MSNDKFEDDLTVDVDEALLGEIRAEAARRESEGAAGDAASSVGGESSRSDHDADIARDQAPDAERSEDPDDSPTLEGFGALREIGRGGFSRVYEALQFEFERWVAIKVLNAALQGEDEVAEFERECRLMGVLSRHPNIVTVFTSAFTSEQRPCIVMELFPHGSYLNILHSTGPLGLQELLSLGIRVSGALATAHRQGMVHGDVKPQNIFRSEFGSVALGDFGIATFMSHGLSADKTRLSLYYAAPELIERGVSATSPFADQYSLGATLYTLATGIRPFEVGPNETTRQLLTRTLTEPVPHLGPDFPSELDDALQQAMSRELNGRHRDVHALAAALAKIEHDLGFAPTEIPFSRDTGRYVGQTLDPNTQPRRTTSSLEAPPSPQQPHTAKAPSAPGSKAGPSISTKDQPPRVATPTGPATGTPTALPDKPSKSRRTALWIKIAIAACLIAAAAATAVVMLPGDDEDDPTAIEGSEENPAQENPAEANPAEASTAEEPSPPEENVEPETELPAAETIETSGPVDGLGTVPTAPTDLNIVSLHNALDVSWIAPPMIDPPIDFYRVEWRPAGESAWETKLAERDDQSTAITGIASDATYIVRVAAVNDIGRGEWIQAQGTTLPRGVPDSPTLEIDALVSGLTVRWEAPETGQWPITKYIVTWEGPDGRITTQEYSASTRIAEISDLDSGDLYQVSVAAENENGRGAWAELEASPVGPPDPPASVVVTEHDRGLAINWEPSSDGGSPITSYRLEWWLDDDLVGDLSVESHEMLLDADVRYIELFELLNGRTYTVSIRAENEVGESQPAVTEGTPNGPQFVMAFASNRDGTEDIYALSPDGQATMRITENNRQERPRGWMPDGTWVLLDVRNPGGDWEIITLNLYTREERWLTCDAVNDWGASLRSDGLELAYTKGSSRNHDIWVMHLQTGEHTPLVVGPSDDTQPTWSPDGTQIAFVRGPAGNRDIFILDVASGQETPLTSIDLPDDSAPSWSPDGTRIAFSRGPWGGGSDRDIIVVDLASGDETAWTQGPDHDDAPDWLPEGSQIAFARGQGNIAPYRNIFVVDQDGTELPIVVDGYDNHEPTWLDNWSSAVEQIDCRNS